MVGSAARSDEDIIGTRDGVVRVRTVRRPPAEQRWNDVQAFMIRGTPRNPTPGKASWRIPARPGGDDDSDHDDDGDDSDDGGDSPDGKRRRVGEADPPEMAERNLRQSLLEMLRQIPRYLR